MFPFVLLFTILYWYMTEEQFINQLIDVSIHDLFYFCQVTCAPSSGRQRPSPWQTPHRWRKCWRETPSTSSPWLWSEDGSTGPSLALSQVSLRTTLYLMTNLDFQYILLNLVKSHFYISVSSPYFQVRFLGCFPW